MSQNNLLSNHIKKSDTTEGELLEIGSQIPPVPEHLPEPSLSETALYIAKTRYARRSDKGQPEETAREMFWRVAYNISVAELLYGADQSQVLAKAESFYKLLSSQKFIPNTPTMLNAGKPMQQLSACFVLPIEDTMTSIGKTLVDMVMIHKSGGGCISGDARVWSTYCGIEPIEVLFSRAIADGRKGFVQGAGVAYDVADLNIKTVSMNPKTGKTGLQKVSHVWKYGVPAEDQLIVTTVEGTTVQTSAWHPFMVVRGTSVVEVRADALTSGDIVLGPGKAEKYWPWKQPKSAGGVRIDTDLGWLIGFTLGDGSFGYVPALRQYRVRWFSGNKDVLEKVQSVLAKRGIKVSIQKDRRGLLIVSTLNQKFVHCLLAACGLEKFGPKDNLIRVPEIISKSPLKVVKAFLAGLLDSDGYVAVDGSPSYCSISRIMVEDLSALVSLLGYHPSLKEKAPYGKGKHPTYTLQICPLPQVNQLAVDLTPYLANKLRQSRLQSSSRRQTSLPLNFCLWRDKLVSLGLASPKGAREEGTVAAQLSVWASHNRIRRDDISFIAKHLYKKEKSLAVMLERIASSGHEIKTVRKAGVAKAYYDLSVDEWNTYAAGQSGLVMIHNTGFSFSRLRPYGDVIASSGGTTVGPCSFLQAYNDVTSQVKQGGVRRGANMGIMHITHPDILRFAVMKVDEFSLTNFNISVTVTEEWMEQIKKDAKFVQEEPVWEEIIEEIKVAQTIRDVDLKLKKVEEGVAKLYDLVRATEEGEGYSLINPRTGEAVGCLNAYKVFLLITQLAWHYGDPGMIMIDRINKSGANPTPNLGQIEATNPCVTGDTLVTTKKGWQRADQIRIGDEIGTIFGIGLVSKIETHKKVPVYKVSFSDGAELKVTAAHQFHAIKHSGRAKNSANKKFAQIQLKDLEVNDVVRVAPALMPENTVPDLPEGWENKDYGFFVGMLLGDGCITRKSLSRNVVKMAVNTNETDWIDRIKHVMLKAGAKTVSLDSGGSGYSANLTDQSSGGMALMVKQSLLRPTYSYEKHIPIEYQNSNREFLAGLIDGLYSTDGNINLSSSHPDIRLKTTSKQLAQDVRRVLLCFGIHGRIAKIKKVKDGHIDGRYIVSRHQQYELHVSGAGVKTFAQQISLSHPDKQNKLVQAQHDFALTGNTWLTRITAVEPAGSEAVYDIYEPVSDTWITEGIVSRGCGEQPLLPYDACTLGSINVGKFVKDGTIDYESLGKAAEEAVHFLDNVLDMNSYPVPEIREIARKIRRIGLGIMGFADLLVQLGLGYNSQEGLRVAEDVMSFVHKHAKEASLKLAEGRGVFPAWEGSIYDSKSPYFLGSELRLRNGAITTIAPTGTIAMLADASSGIEPYFGLSYAKNTIEGKRLFTTNPFFLKIAKDEGFYSDELLEKIEQNGGSVQGLSEVPQKWQAVFVVTKDITPEWHVRMQAAFQKHVDNAISKTINFPNAATVEDVRQTYMMVYELGCKGITIYRDGSRVKQVLEVKKDKSYYDQLAGGKLEHASSPAPLVLGPVKAPTEAWGVRIKKKSDVGNVYTAVFNTDEGQPVEVFVTVGKSGGYVAGAAEVTGRLASLALKHGASLEEVASELIGIACGTPYGIGPTAILSMFDAAGKALLETSFNRQLSFVSDNSDKVDGVVGNGNGHSGMADVFNYAASQTYQSLFAACPDCGSTLMVIEGCKKCSNPACGFSKC